MDRIGEFLGTALRRMDRPEAAMAWLSSAWPTIVGKALAEHTLPVRCQSGCLELAADGKPWQRQLESMKREICARVNQAWGGKLVSELKFAPDSGSVGTRKSSPGPTRASLKRITSIRPSSADAAPDKSLAKTAYEKSPQARYLHCRVFPLRYFP